VSHLGDRITDLVDGQLSPQAQERAHAHLAGCPECRAAVEAERLMKARLAGLPAPQPGQDLTRRLLAMGGPQGPLAPRTGHVPGSPRPRPVAAPRPARAAFVSPGPARPVAISRGPVPRGPSFPGRPVLAGRTGRLLPGAVPRGRRTRMAAAVLGTLGVVGLGGVVHATTQAGGQSPPTVVPPVDSFVLEHATTSGDLPFTDVPAGWRGTCAAQEDTDGSGSLSDPVGSCSGAGR